MCSVVFFHGRLAKALVVGRVNEQRPVPTVRPDVVHHRGPGTDAPPGALPTPWLPQELGRAQVVGPDGQAIPAVPLGGDPPGRFAGLMLGAVPLPGEGRASGMAARPERLQGHRAITSGQNKKPAPTSSHLGRSSAPANDRALAMVDIHDKLCLAVPAPEDQVFRAGLRVGLLVRELLAVRTDIASVLYA